MKKLMPVVVVSKSLE